MIVKIGKLEYSTGGYKMGTGLNLFHDPPNGCRAIDRIWAILQNAAVFWGKTLAQPTT
jgi:hypothetical protein